jgi:O-antigen/teichoic acid export membrane protein
VQFFGFGVSLVVARVLLPSEYGAASLALALAAFAVIFSELTLGAGLVQRPSVGQADASSLMWFSLAVGLVLSASFALLTPELASLVGHPGIRPLLLAIAPVFAVSAAGTVPTALLNRRMAFRLLELRMIATTVISSTCALLVALLGGGAWALVVQQLVWATLLTTFAWVGARWRPSLVLSRRHLGTLAPFALYVAGTRTLGTVGTNLDNLLVGRFLGTAALGVYGLAYNILLIPLTRLSGPIEEVAFPTFSSLGSSAAVGRLWLRANVALCATLAPILVALAVEAQDFVDVVLGPKWADAGPVIRLLTIGALAQLSGRLVPSVLQACRRQRLLFALAVLSTTMLVAGFIIGLRWDTVGVAAAYAITCAITMPINLTLTLRETTVAWREFARSIAPVVTASVLMALTMLCFHLGVPASPLARLLAASAAGIAVFAIVLRWRAHALLTDLRMLAAAAR